MVGLCPPEQLRTGRARPIPELEAVKATVGQAQHPRRKRAQKPPGERALVGCERADRDLEQRVRAALDQRIATRYQLAPMDLAESAQYLRHHLALVGRTDPLVADDAIARLHKASLGLPRALNNAALVGTLHGRRQPDAHDSPSTSIRITSS